MHVLCSHQTCGVPCLNCRFDVNGIQNALRSFGATLSLLDMAVPFLKVPQIMVAANAWYFRSRVLVKI